MRYQLTAMPVKVIFILFLYLNVSLASPIQATGCTIKLDAEKYDPIIAKSIYEQLNPDSADLNINVSDGDTVVIGCPGGTLTYGSKTNKTIVATCESGEFLVDDVAVSLDPLYCSKYAAHSARYTNNTCEGTGKEVEVGFNLDVLFVQTMRICFNDTTKNTFYSYYNLSSKVEFYLANVPRPTFVEDDFYSLDKKVNDLYTRKIQQATINGLLGLEATSTKYVQDTSDYYLARGHLTAKTDYVWASQQRATFHYVNVVPQWQTANAGNWKTAEDNVRDYAVAKQLDLLVYTGPYRISTLPHEDTGKPVELYLYSDENNNDAIPLPELTWKLVYNPLNGDNVVLITANNPYLETITPICTDVADSLTWMTWTRNDVKKGLSYACNAKEVQPIISYFPDFKFNDLLV